jgi:ketosteroid isomerase-like protein
MMSEHDDILAILTRYEDAVRRRDPKAVLADYVADPIAYDLAPPLFHEGKAILDVEALQGWFDTWEDDLRITHRDPHVLSDGDLGVLYALQKMSGTKKGEAFSELWFRCTVATQRIDGAWKIAHIHTSVPFAMDGSGKAMLDLTPESEAV